MPKPLRFLLSGSWLNIKTCCGSDSYWLRPLYPSTTQAIVRERLVSVENYRHSLFPQGQKAFA